MPLQRVTPLRRRAQANAPAASYPRRRRALRLDASFMQGTGVGGHAQWLVNIRTFPFPTCTSVKCLTKKIQKACICKTKLRLPESNARIDVFVLIIVHLFVFFMTMLVVVDHFVDKTDFLYFFCFLGP